VHELSLALEICRIAERTVGHERLPLVRELELEVGTDSEVEIANLSFCLESLLTHRPFVGASHRIVRVPGSDMRVLSLEVDDGGP
jgi:Zn finger protein HypA/HybF involved in hydrogenase expression